MPARSALVALVALSLLAAPTGFAVVPGVAADFDDGSLHGFFSAQSALANVATGGAGGVGDGWMRVSTTTPVFLGAATASPALTGDLTGIQAYSFRLRDVGAPDGLEIHVGFGQAFTNVWISKQGFVPPTDGWGEFSVPLRESAFVQTFGEGFLTFEDALASSDRLLFRHDQAPIEIEPNGKTGDFGLDLVRAVGAPVPTTSGWGLLATALLLLFAGARKVRGDGPKPAAPNA